MIKNFFGQAKNLAASQTARYSYITIFGAGINALLGFIFTIIVARSLGPADFGTFSVISSLILIFISFSDLGTISSANRFLPTATEENKEKIIKIVYLVNFAVASLLTVFLFLIASPLSEIFFKTNNFSSIIALSSPAVLGLCLWTVGFGILYAKKEFLKGVLVDTSAVIFKIIAVFFIILFYKLNLFSTLLAFTYTPFLTLFIALIFITPKFLKASISGQLVRQILSFSIWIFLAKIAIAGLGQIDNIMLVGLTDQTATGLYAAANRITFIFPVLINGLSVVLMPRFASFNQIEDAKKFLKKIMAVTLLFIIPTAFLFIISDSLVFWIYGASYMPASFVFRFLLLRTIFFLAATGPLTMLVFFFGQSKTFAFLSILQLVVLVISNLIFIPQFGAAGPAISGAIAYGIIFLASFYVISQKLKKG